jgi:predicted dinucleotide-binding enzyme
MTKPKIAVLGTGDVGQRLASGFASKGYAVMMGTRTPDKEEVRAWLKEAPAGCAAGTLVQAATFGDVVVLAVSGEGAENTLMLAGHANLRGKVVVDVTNPLAHGPEGPSLTVGHTDSLGERIQRWVPEARVVKTLNIISNGMMVDPPRLDGLTPDMLLCGNDEEAKRTVMALLRDLGWPKDSLVDMGGIEGARLLEPLAMLWIAYGFQNDHWTHAFKFIGR